MLIGVHERYSGLGATSFARTVQTFPMTTVAREFESGVLNPQDLVRRLVARCQPMWEQGKTVVWSFKPALADVDNGAWKPFIVQLAQYIKANKLHGKVIVCVWHEPENDFKTAAPFVRMFNAVHDWIKEVDAGILTTHAALGYYYRNLSTASAKKWITKADIHSIDIYSGRSFPLSMTLANSKPFQIWKSALPAGAAWGVSERGFIADDTKSAERVATIKAEAEWLAQLPDADKPRFYIVWNTPGTEDDPTIVLDQAGTAAVNDMFASVARVICPLCQGSGLAQPGTTYVITHKAT